MSSTTNLPAGVILLPPGEGRSYACGPMQSRFLADGKETGDRYSVSIWWVDPGNGGPGAHSHEANEELFYGTFLRIPAGVTHDFENRTSRPAGALNVFIPGGFESNMPAIAEWFRAQATSSQLPSIA